MGLGQQRTTREEIDRERREREGQKVNKWKLFSKRERRETQKRERQQKWKGRKEAATRGRYNRDIARTNCPHYSPNVLAISYTSPFNLSAMVF